MKSYFRHTTAIILFAVVVISLCIGTRQSYGQKTVPPKKAKPTHIVIIVETQTPGAHNAAKELSGYLKTAFPKTKVEVKKGSDEKDPDVHPSHGILVGIKNPRLSSRLPDCKEKLKKPQSYVIAQPNVPHPLPFDHVCIIGADVAGLRYAARTIRPGTLGRN